MSIAAMKRIQYVVAFGMLGAFLAPSAGQAQTLDINYYTISSNDPDANHLTQGTFTNEVQNALGPNGLPVLNIPLYGCSTNCYSVNGAPGFPSGGSTPNVNVYNPTGEITYWSPSNSSSPTANQYVTETLSTTTALPFNVPQNFFPPNGTGTGGDGGNNGFQAAQLFGTITAPSTEQLSFNIGSDDMAFAYIDNQLVCSDGGVHGSTSVCGHPLLRSVLRRYQHHSVRSHVLDHFPRCYHLGAAHRCPRDRPGLCRVRADAVVGRSRSLEAAGTGAGGDDRLLRLAQ
jgi:hypothetical protein